MDDEHLRVSLKKLTNRTFVASIINMHDGHNDVEPYDYSGALIYVTAVLFIFGFSIIFMIIGFVRRSYVHDGMDSYFKELKKVHMAERRIAKYRISATMQSKSMHVSGAVSGAKLQSPQQLESARMYVKVTPQRGPSTSSSCPSEDEDASTSSESEYILSSDGGKTCGGAAGEYRLLIPGSLNTVTEEEMEQESPLIPPAATIDTVSATEREDSTDITFIDTDIPNENDLEQT